MPINNFKLFDENKANMMTDDDYAINQQRLNGVQSGVASSQLQNKTLYQTALMCYALAQLMAANGHDANDANAVSTFVNNLSQSMVQKVVDKATDEDISSANDNKWVSAGKLKYFKNSIVQIKSYIGSGNVHLGYKRILTFDHLPKIVMFMPNLNLNLKGFENLKTIKGNLGRHERFLKDVLTQDVEYIQYNLQRKSDNYYKDSYAQKVTFNTETSNVELELVDMGSKKDEIVNNENNISYLYELANVEYVYIGLF